MSGSDGTTWITWLCSLRGNEFLCEVQENYINALNLRGLHNQVPNYREALDIILDVEPAQELEINDNIEQAAEMLYGLIHARYILTHHGMGRMIVKFQSGDFGHCPRVYCERQQTLPIGLSDIPGQETVKLYCPKCNDVYTPLSRHRLLDGAWFGMGFPHALFMAHPQHRPQRPTNQFVPRAYGFRIHSSALHQL